MHLLLNAVDLLHDTLELLADFVDSGGAFFHVDCTGFHCFNGGGSVILNGGNAFANFISGNLRFGSELADFLGNYGETATVFTCASGLDSGVQREQVRLFSDGGDSFNDLPDLLRTLTEFLNNVSGAHDALFNVSHFLNGNAHKFRAVLSGVGGIVSRLCNEAGFFGHFLYVTENHVNIFFRGVNIV